MTTSVCVMAQDRSGLDTLLLELGTYTAPYALRPSHLRTHMIDVANEILDQSSFQHHMAPCDLIKEHNMAKSLTRNGLGQNGSKEQAQSSKLVSTTKARFFFTSSAAVRPNLHGTGRKSVCSALPWLSCAETILFHSIVVQAMRK